MTADANQTPHGEVDDIATPQGDNTTDVADSSDIDPDNLQAKVVEITQQSRKHERRAKQLAAELAEFKQKVASMVDPEKVESVEAQAITERQAREQAERELTRYKVAVAKGLTESQAKRLVGDNEDELLADADVLLTELGATKPRAAAAKDGSNAVGAKTTLTPAELMKAATFG